jgi:protein gp37
MADKTGIQWTDATWNPVTGCSKVSPGCAHCYAEEVARRDPGRYAADGVFRPWTPENTANNVILREEVLEKPLAWTRPRMVFVNSMSDLFHEDVPFSFIDRVFATMAAASVHTFQVLTKRPERMLAYFERTAAHRGVELAELEPLANVWLGISIENHRYNSRADVLRATPAAKRFISAEPLLGPLAVDGPGTLDLERIDWVIVGGESGPGARRMDLQWALDVQAACDDAGVAYFFKQLGAVTAAAVGARGKGADPADWPAKLRVRAKPAGPEPVELSPAPADPAR